MSLRLSHQPDVKQYKFLIRMSPRLGHQLDVKQYQLPYLIKALKIKPICLDMLV